ncbi:MAG: YIP1 family protein [Paludibacter sp.]|nr:YIP1 family protein [Paludibacter sp.]
MKSKNLSEFLFNPFTRIAGWQAFGIGLIFIALMGVIGTYANIIFDGVIDMHIEHETTLTHSFILLAIDIISLVFVMFVAGLFIAGKFRFVDILGTMTLSKAPFLLLAIVGFFTKMPDMSDVLKDPFIMLSSPSLVFLLLLSLPVILWSIALMYNGFKVSTGAKGTKLTITFITAVFVAEIISKVLIHFILKRL